MSRIQQPLSSRCGGKIFSQGKSQWGIPRPKQIADRPHPCATGFRGKRTGLLIEYPQ